MKITKQKISYTLVLAGLLFSLNSYKNATNHRKDLNSLINANPLLEEKSQDLIQTKEGKNNIICELRDASEYPNSGNQTNVEKVIDLYRKSPTMMAKYDSLSNRLNYLESDSILMNYDKIKHSIWTSGNRDYMATGLGGILSLTGAIGFFKNLRRERKIKGRQSIK